MEDFTDFICYQMKASMKKVEKYMGQRFEEYGVNLAQSFILFSLLERDGLTLTEIGNRTGIENSSLTTMVDRLEKEELVKRSLDAQDRRVIRLFITSRGRELAEKVLDMGTDFNRRLRNCLGDSEEHFIKGLQKIYHGMDNIKKQ
ncbi:MAG: MarR family winged helix-turn-helix transcriptional regulator [Bacillota bacterium]